MLQVKLLTDSITEDDILNTPFYTDAITLAGQLIGEYDDMVKSAKSSLSATGVATLSPTIRNIYDDDYKKAFYKELRMKRLETFKQNKKD